MDSCSEDKMAMYTRNVLAISVCLIGLLYPVVTSANQYIVEAKLFVDKAAVDKWTAKTGKTQQDLPLEINSTIYEVSQFYKSLQTYNLNVDIRIKELRVLDTNILPADDKGKIQNEIAASTFEQWLKNNQDTHNDLAVLLTGYDMYLPNTNFNPFGYAYYGGVCSTRGVGVVELSGTFIDVLALSHEMGHILGSSHDGEKQGKPCRASDAYVMSPRTMYANPNHAVFSSCSAHMMKQTFDRLTQNGNNCLLDGDSSSVLTGPRFGSLVTPDQLCKRSYGASSSVARKAYTSYGDNLCVQLACMKKAVGNRFFWDFVPTPPGMNCGTSKQCFDHRCVTTSHGDPLMPDVCPFGDQPWLGGIYQTTCSAITQPNNCVGWEKDCCHSCPTV